MIIFMYSTYLYDVLVYDFVGVWKKINFDWEERKKNILAISIFGDQHFDLKFLTSTCFQWTNNIYYRGNSMICIIHSTFFYIESVHNLDKKKLPKPTRPRKKLVNPFRDFGSVTSKFSSEEQKKNNSNNIIFRLHWYTQLFNWQYSFEQEPLMLRPEFCFYFCMWFNTSDQT